jgi:hypothetical protein
MTTVEWETYGLTVCVISTLAAVYGSTVEALTAYLARPSDRRALRSAGSTAIALAFLTSVIVAALFSVHPLLLPIVATIFSATVISGVGLAYAAVLLEHALSWIRHVLSTSTRHRSA